MARFPAKAGTQPGLAEPRLPSAKRASQKPIAALNFMNFVNFGPAPPPPFHFVHFARIPPRRRFHFVHFAGPPRVQVVHFHVRPRFGLDQQAAQDPAEFRNAVGKDEDSKKPGAALHGFFAPWQAEAVA